MLFAGLLSEIAPHVLFSSLLFLYKIPVYFMRNHSRCQVRNLKKPSDYDKHHQCHIDILTSHIPCLGQRAQLLPRLPFHLAESLFQTRSSLTDTCFIRLMQFPVRFLYTGNSVHRQRPAFSWKPEPRGCLHIYRSHRPGS